MFAISDSSLCFYPWVVRRRRLFYQDALLRTAAPSLYIFWKMSLGIDIEKIETWSVSASCSPELGAFCAPVQPTWTLVSQCMYATWVEKLFWNWIIKQDISRKEAGNLMLCLAATGHSSLIIHFIGSCERRRASWWFERYRTRLHILDNGEC